MNTSRRSSHLAYRRRRPAGLTSKKQIPSSWRKELRRLVEGEERGVALISDPRFAWIFYRIGRRCWVQEKFSLNGDFTDISPRQTHTDEGQLIREWNTILAQIMHSTEADYRDNLQFTITIHQLTFSPLKSSR